MPFDNTGSGESLTLQEWLAENHLSSINKESSENGFSSLKEIHYLNETAI